MTRRFIPDGDRAFAAFARFFVERIAEHPALFNLTLHSIERAATLVREFREALAVQLKPAMSTVFTRRIKDDARRAAEAEIRRLGRIIRADDRVSAHDKAILNIRQTSGKGRRRTLPEAPPCLQFLGPGKNSRKHVLLCTERFGSPRRRKPHGAVRAELFVGFVRPEDVAHVLGSPCAQAAALAPALIYLRSFTTSWIEVEFPLPGAGEPMLLVYWARWANAVGEVGPRSKPAPSRIEYASPRMSMCPSLQAAPLEARDGAAQCEATNGVHVLPPRKLPAASSCAMPEREARLLMPIGARRI